MNNENLIMTAPEQGSVSVKANFNKIALVDADFIKYLTCSDISNYIRSNGHHPQLKYGPSFLYRFVDAQMKRNFFDRFDCPGMLFCFSGNSSDTFRSMIGFTKKYKANRGNSEPAYDGFYSDLAGVISIVSQSYNIYVHENYEADDIVSCLQNPNTFIYSRDKDLKQVPGYHYDVARNDIVEISDNDAEYSLWLQMLMGDSSDNIPGIEGIGETTAKKILEGVSINHRRNVVIQAYLQKYGSIEGMDRFCENWLLVKMRINRGGYEAEKLQGAYYLRDLLISNLKNGTR